jgi:L-lactate dehydrogenase (cytochrome)
VVRGSPLDTEESMSNQAYAPAAPYSQGYRRQDGGAGPWPQRAADLVGKWRARRAGTQGVGVSLATAGPFETVAEAQRIAERRLPGPVYQALIAGTEQGLTLDDNLEAFNELGLRTRVFDKSDVREQRTTVLGQDLPFPVILSPVGVQAVHPEGEVAVARAAVAAGTAMGLSSFASKSIEEVAAVNPKTFFQLYWVGNRDHIAARVERAKKAGAKALIVTLDISFAARRDWGSPVIPQQLNLPTIVRYAPMAIANPAWTASFLRHGKLPDLTVPNLAVWGEPDPGFFDAYGTWAQTPQPTWEDLQWLRSIWSGPFMVKGILEPDEARRAVDLGATAISVSNHGGNNVDGAPASIRMLPAVVEAVGDQIEVVLDGGIRRGSDVVKALALGAKAVLIGRAFLWGLAAGGETGVRHVLKILRDGIDENLLALSRASIHELTPDDLVVPEDFAIAPAQGRGRAAAPAPPLAKAA